MALRRFVSVLRTLRGFDATSVYFAKMFVMRTVAVFFWKNGMGVDVQWTGVRAIKSAWNKAGIGSDIMCMHSQNCISAIHQKVLQLKTGLTDVMCHRVETALKSYHLVQRVTAADASVQLRGVFCDRVDEPSAVISVDQWCDVINQSSRIDEMTSATSAALMSSTGRYRSNHIFQPLSSTRLQTVTMSPPLYLVEENSQSFLRTTFSFCPLYSSEQFVVIRYDTIEEFDMDSKADWSA